jgi:1-aminocyclopropane-1-carboxylate deaminase/D-cysteine desulfhydrase
MRGDDPGGAPSGNLLLDALLGADVRYAGTEDWAEVAALAEAASEELRGAGEQPVTLPAGCSSPTGALGFAAAYAELLGQLDERGVDAAAVVHASTSGGTHAGLLLGRALAGRGPVPRGFDVGQIVPDAGGLVAWLASEAAALAGSEARFDAADVALDPTAMGERYGAFTDAATEAIRLLARTEGVLLDPVYSGKGMAGLIADARAGRLEGPAVFWHTGGGPSLFAAGWADPLLA